MNTEAKSQSTITETATTKPNQMLGDEQINRIIDQVNSRKITGKGAIEELIDVCRSLRTQGQDVRLKLGRGYHLLKSECEPYEKSPDTGLTYNQAVAKTGVPRSSAERYRQMYEASAEHGIPGDTFLTLGAEGVNLADLDKGFIGTWLHRIQGLDISDGKAVAKLIDDIKAAKPKGMTPRTLAELDAELKELKESLDSAMEKKNSNQVLDISSHITEREEEKGKICVTRMQSLLDAVAPFFGWSRDQVKNRMKAFEAEPAPLRINRYTEALTFMKKIEDAFAITAKAAA